MTGNLLITPIELIDNRRSYEIKNAVSKGLHFFQIILQSDHKWKDMVLFSSAFSKFQLVI